MLNYIYITHSLASHFKLNSPFSAPSFLCAHPLISLSLSLPPYIAALLRKQGVGRQSHSPFQGSKSLFFLCFPRSCSVLHVAALLSCSTLSPTVSLPPSPPTVGVCLVTEHLSGFCLLISSHQLCVHTCFRIWTTPCSLWRCSVLFTFNNTCTSGCHILHVL